MGSASTDAGPGSESGSDCSRHSPNTLRSTSASSAIAASCGSSHCSITLRSTSVGGISVIQSPPTRGKDSSSQSPMPCTTPCPLWSCIATSAKPDTTRQLIEMASAALPKLPKPATPSGCRKRGTTSYFSEAADRAQPVRRTRPMPTTTVNMLNTRATKRTQKIGGCRLCSHQ